MRSLIFTLLFIPSVAFADLIKLQEPCVDSAGETLANLKSCTVLIQDQSTHNVVAQLLIPASSAAGCKEVQYDTSSVDKLIQGARNITAFCTTLTDKASAASGVIAHEFRGRATAAPSLTVEDTN